MSNTHEVERIKQVYRGYRESSAVQAQWSEDNPGNRRIVRERTDSVRTLLDTHELLPLTNQRILEVGCGSGSVLASLCDLGATPQQLHGVDLLPDRIAAARRRFPTFNFRRTNAEHLAFPDAHFDLVLVFTVFSSILDDDMAHNVAREIARVLRPGGAVLWYDFRYDNPRNPHVRGMTERHITALFPGFHLDLHTLTLLPPLARRLGRLTPLLYPLLVRVPLLRTHYLGLLWR